MDWKNCKDCLPADGQRVLVCIGGVYHIARFAKDRREFEEIDTGEVFSLNGPEEVVYWTTITEPSEVVVND